MPKEIIPTFPHRPCGNIFYMWQSEFIQLTTLTKDKKHQRPRMSRISFAA